MLMLRGASRGMPAGGQCRGVETPCPAVVAVWQVRGTGLRLSCLRSVSPSPHCTCSRLPLGVGVRVIQSCCGVTAIGPSLPAEPSVGVTQQCWRSTEPKAWSFQTDSGSRPACTTGCGGRERGGRAALTPRRRLCWGHSACMDLTPVSPLVTKACGSGCDADSPGPGLGAEAAPPAAGAVGREAGGGCSGGAARGAAGPGLRRPPEPHGRPGRRASQKEPQGKPSARRKPPVW